jgi:hypothetical protein
MGENSPNLVTLRTTEVNHFDTGSCHRGTKNHDLLILRRHDDHCATLRGRIPPVCFVFVFVGTITRAYYQGDQMSL